MAPDVFPELPPIAPPTRPGAVVHRPFRVWHRFLAVLGIIVGTVSALLAAFTIAYPTLSGWLGERAGPGFQDDIAGTLRYYRAPDIVLEVVTLAAGVALVVLSRRVWRLEPGIVRTMRRWCIGKIALEVASAALLTVQAWAYFSRRTDIPPAAIQGCVIGMVAWGVLTGLPFPVLTLAWLVTPRVRRDEGAAAGPAISAARPRPAP